MTYAFLSLLKKEEYLPLNNGWKVVIGIEPDKVEDISDVQRLLG